MTDWSHFSPCSVSCGLGKKLRTRMPLNKAYDASSHHKRITRLYNSGSRSNNNDNEASDEEEDDYNENTLENGLIDDNDPCKSVPTIEQVVCGQNQPPCDNDVYGLPRKFYIQ